MTPRAVKRYRVEKRLNDAVADVAKAARELRDEAGSYRLTSERDWAALDLAIEEWSTASAEFFALVDAPLDPRRA